MLALHWLNGLLTANWMFKTHWFWLFALKWLAGPAAQPSPLANGWPNVAAKIKMLLDTCVQRVQESEALYGDMVTTFRKVKQHFLWGSLSNLSLICFKWVSTWHWHLTTNDTKAKQAKQFKNCKAYSSPYQGSVCLGRCLRRGDIY